MEVKINSRLFFMGLLCMLLTAAIILPLCTRAFYTQAVDNVEQACQLIAASYDTHPGEPDLSAFEEHDLRITLISPSGEVLYENKADSASLGDHSTREEVVEAIRDGSAQVTRYSSTMGTDTYYCARRLDDGNILRVSRSTSAMWEVYNKTMPVGILLAFGILLASIVLSVFLTRQLVAPITGLGSNLDEIEEHVPYPELQPFADSIRQYRLRERENERQRREFTANVSHELKTPLTSISGYAEMIENGMCRPEDIKSFGARIHAEASRLVTLVGDIINLSKLDEADAPPVMEKVDLSRLAENNADLLALNAENAGIELVCGGAPAIVMGSASILSEMIYNLCDNAIRYNRRGGHVWINTGSDGQGRAFVEVSDDGIGIPHDQQGRVFERFYRVDKSHSRETGGTGLGLAIVKHAAALHGGDISLKSEEGEGTSIRITFTEAAS